MVGRAPREQCGAPPGAGRSRTVGRQGPKAQVHIGHTRAIRKKQALRRPWGRGGGEAGEPGRRQGEAEPQSPGSREGAACKGGGSPDKIQKTQLSLDFK